MLQDFGTDEKGSRNEDALHESFDNEDTMDAASFSSAERVSRSCYFIDVSAYTAQQMRDLP